MFFSVQSPEYFPMDAKQQDQLLAQGYFRHGHIMAGYEMLLFEDQIQGVVPLRVPLPCAITSKHQRKLMRRNGSRFRLEVHPFYLTPDKERLFGHYRQYRFSEDEGQAKTLLTFLTGWHSDARKLRHYNTWELAFYDQQGRLAAMSLVDLGAETLSSLVCFYHPRYEADSLGTYSMLVELEWAQALGMRYYYPGYTLDRPSCFDYKCRLPGLQAYDWQQGWMEWPQIDLQQSACHQSLKRMQALLPLLQRRMPQLKPELLENQAFFSHIWHNTFEVAQVVRAPFYVQCRLPSGLCLQAYYLPHKQAYYLEEQGEHHLPQVVGIFSDPQQVCEQLAAYVQQAQGLQQRLVSLLSPVRDLLLARLPQRVRQLAFSANELIPSHSLGLNFELELSRWSIRIHFEDGGAFRYVVSYHNEHKSHWQYCGWAPTPEETVRLVTQQAAR